MIFHVGVLPSGREKEAYTTYSRHLWAKSRINFFALDNDDNVLRKNRTKMRNLKHYWLTTLSFQALNIVTNVTGRVGSSWRVRSNRDLEKIHKTDNSKLNNKNYSSVNRLAMCVKTLSWVNRPAMRAKALDNTVIILWSWQPWKNFLVIKVTFYKAQSSLIVQLLLLNQGRTRMRVDN